MNPHRLPKTVLAAMFALYSVLGGAPAWAANWYVTPSGDDAADCQTASTPCLTINGAIGKAADWDTVFVAEGIYTATSGNEVVLIQKSVTVSGGWDQSFGAQTGTSVIDGGGVRRGLKVGETAHVTADRFTIQRGFNDEYVSIGGGILNDGTLTLNDCVINGNQADDCGGGISSNGVATLNNCTITNNHSNGVCGGGISNHGGTFTLNNCVITNNHAEKGSGGGVNNVVGTLTLDNCVINNNIAWGGGGISNYTGGTLLVNRTTVSGNIAGVEGDGGSDAGGGGIYIGSGTVVLNNSTVSGNIVRGSFPGSGISANFCSLQVNNSTVSGNSGGYGEGIYSVGFAPYHSMTLNNSTISQNQKWGMIVDCTNVTVRNTIIAGNGANSDCCRPPGSSTVISSGGYNLVGNGEGCPIAAAPGDQIGSSSEPIDALLLPLRAYGGSTMTHALSLGSPALDAGNPAAPGSGGSACPPTDQRGQPRPDGSRCDIGAFEGHVAAVLSIERTDPNPSIAASVDFVVTFSEPVTGVDTAAPFDDFTLTTTGLAGASITGVTGAGDTYTVSVQTDSGDGTIRLDVVDDDSILDGSGIPLGTSGTGNGDFTGGEVYEIWYNPRVTSIVRADSDPTNATSVNFTVTFSEPVTGVDAVAPFSDFALAPSGVTGASITAVIGSGDTYTVSVQTGSGVGTIRLEVVDDDSILDAGDNPLGGPGVGNGSFVDGEVYTMWGTPLVTSIVRTDPDPTNSISVDFTVTFSEPVSGIDTAPPFGDFSLAATGLVGASISAVTGSGDTYTVTVAAGSGDGTIRLDVVDDDSVHDSRGNPLGGPGAGNGDFTSGEVYTIWGNPRVVSVVRTGPDPVESTSVTFTVTFTEPVSGVDLAPPFSDFTLTTTGVTTAAVTSVYGSGDTYSVTVSLDAHSGNGTIRLDVVDDDSIVDVSGDHLGGAGIGNGNFTSGETYTVLTIPPQLSPAGSIATTRPTYEWTRVPGATRYRYQLYKGSALVYTKVVSSSICGETVCASTPTTSIGMGSRKWRVQCLLGGKWRRYSPYRTFTVTGQAGYWSGAVLDFSVTPDLASVQDFSIYIRVGGCGAYRITRVSPVAIAGNRFSFRGSFYASGTFTSPTKATGKLGLRRFFIPDCGYVSGGPISWTGRWRQAGPFKGAEAADSGPISVTPLPDIPADDYRVEPLWRSAQDRDRPDPFGKAIGPD